MKKAKKNPKNIVLKLSLLGLSYYWVCQDLRSPITCHLHNKLFGKKSFMRASHKMHCLQHNLNSSYNYVLWHVHVWEKRGLHTRKLNRRKVLCKCKNIKKLQIFCIEESKIPLQVSPIVLDFIIGNSVLLFSPGDVSPNINCKHASNLECVLQNNLRLYILYN